MQCIYDAPVHPSGLTPIKGFNQVYMFTFDTKNYCTIVTSQGSFVFNENKNLVNPYNDFSGKKINQFITYSSNPRNLKPLNIDDIVQKFSREFEFDCGGPETEVYKSPVKMFCLDSYYQSKLRFKLLCAFGLLRNFINHTKFNLLIRGGMALRLHLTPDSELRLPESAPYTDMDGLIIVDSSVSDKELDEFKTTFMRLLVLSIKDSINPSDQLICAVAKGDSDTIKIKIHKHGGITELGDIGFKRTTNTVVQVYSDHRHHQYLMVKSMLCFPYIWVYPSRELMKMEYDYVTQQIQQQLKETVEAHDANPELPIVPNKSKFESDLRKFRAKQSILSRGHGGKRMTVRYKKRKSHTKKRR